MQKKAIFTVLGVMLAVIVASITLVFTVGPRVSADDDEVVTVPVEYLIIRLDGKRLSGLTKAGREYYENGGRKYRVVIPEGVTELWQYIEGGSGFDQSFQHCRGLVEIVIPNSVNTINGDQFYGDEGLTSVDFLGTLDEWAQIVFQEQSSNPLLKAHRLKLDGEEVTNGVLTTATRITKYAFERCTSLTSIEIPSSVTSIGDYAFEHCTSLTSVKISSGVERIGRSAFNGCESLTSIEIPRSVTSVGESAFSGCSNLTEIIVRNPDLVNTVKYGNKVHYGADENTVTFNSNGAGEIASQTITYGEVATEPAEPTITGRTFAGWYLDENFTKPFSFDTPIKYDITLYAKWTSIVNFDSNGGSPIVAQTVVYNKKATRPNSPTKTNYGFQYWYLDDENVAFNFNTPITSDITLHAKWELNTYTIWFDNSYIDNSIETQTITPGGKVTKPNDPKRSHYTFLGWYTDWECTQPYDFNEPVTQSWNLYAKWIRNYTVTFKSMGGTAVKKQIVDKGSKATAPTAEKDGYKLVGWVTENGEKFDFNTAIKKDITLYAEWKKDNTITIAVAGGVGGTAGLSTIATILGVVIHKKRRK